MEFIQGRFRAGAQMFHLPCPGTREQKLEEYTHGARKLRQHHLFQTPSFGPALVLAQKAARESYASAGRWPCTF